MSTYGLLEVVHSFLVEKRASNVAKGTLMFYTQKLDKFLAFCKSKNITDIEQIEPVLLREFIISLEQAGHKDGGIHAFYRVIKTFLYFYENEYEPDDWKNPIRKVKPPRVSVEPLEGISLTDFDLLVDECQSNTFYGERDKAILFTLLDTGVRATELLNIKMEDIDYSSILVRKGKGRKPRYVFIGKRARKQIRRWLKYRGKQDGYLFTTFDGYKLTFSGLREIIRRLSKRANIKEPGLHDFRRTFALESLKKGVDIQSLSRLMGHSDLQVLSRYLKQTPNDLQNAYKSILDES